MNGEHPLFFYYTVFIIHTDVVQRIHLIAVKIEIDYMAIILYIFFLFLILRNFYLFLLIFRVILNNFCE